MAGCKTAPSTRYDRFLAVGGDQPVRNAWVPMDVVSVSIREMLHEMKIEEKIGIPSPSDNPVHNRMHIDRKCFEAMLWFNWNSHSVNNSINYKKEHTL